MLKKLFPWLREPEKNAPAPQAQQESASYFSTHRGDGDNESRFIPVKQVLEKLVAQLPKAEKSAEVMLAGQDDSSNGAPDLKQYAGAASVSDTLISWFQSQTFFGHQLCAILAQHWLIMKACAMLPRDAVRKGWDVVTVTGDDLPDDAAKMFKVLDRRMNIRQKMEEFATLGRVFGIRIAIFKVESTDPEYYEKPFNPDGVMPGSYKGIVMIDPYWCSPLLDGNAASRPETEHFYEPTYWQVNGKKYHRSHLVIFRTDQPPDILKPTYLYGGIPLPQLIMERVYAAERTANEAPQLAQTKRTAVWLTDMEAFMANEANARNALRDWTYYRDNYGVKIGDKDGDAFEQHDTSLSDLSDVIMTNYQLVAAVAETPATKLLSTPPKGFDATGEYDEASYRETLETIQANKLTPFIERHHLLLMRSVIAPKLKIEPIETFVQWAPLDSPTAKELADTNLVKAQTGAALVQSGAIDSMDERKRVAMDKDSGYHTLGLEMEREPDDDDIDDGDPDKEHD